jgi:hypothetical protein
LIPTGGDGSGERRRQAATGDGDGRVVRACYVGRVADWIERLRSLVRTDRRAPDTEQSRRVEAAIGERVLHGSEAAWLDAVTAAIGGRPDARTIEVLVAGIKSARGELAEEEAAAHVAFWRQLAAAAPGDVILAAHFADAELTLGDPRAGLARLLDVLDVRPELFVEFGWDLEDDARAAGGELRFRWQLHQLRWFIQAGVELAEVGDEAREVYGALLDDYRDEPARLAELQALGEEIRRLEIAGELPRAMVVRQRRRRGEAEG